MRPLKIGLIRETKDPPDSRVAFPPAEAAALLSRFPHLSLVVEPSEIRCFSDTSYREAGLTVTDQLDDCDLLIGIKEVKPEYLREGKSYLFFAHVAKEQPYNRELLKAILKKRVTLIDYEYLTDIHGVRLIAFGRWAGIVGAYNGLRLWGERSGRYKLKPAHECHDWVEMQQQLAGLDPGSVRILVTGGGRVARGAMETLSLIGATMLSPSDYLESEETGTLISRIDPWDYLARNDGREFDLVRFFEQPGNHHSRFKPYARKTDLLITGHFWDPRSPRLWEPELMKSGEFRIGAIADISCDILGSVPCTLRATTIADPFYGYDPVKEIEVSSFTDPGVISMMTIDNLPGELPRDASSEFARVLGDSIIPLLGGEDQDGVICRATIAHNGKLTERYAYLEGYLSGP